jgi:hypothetical protein
MIYKTKNHKMEKGAEIQQLKAFQLSKGELAIKLVAPRKILLSWDVSEVPKKILAAFFQESFGKLVSLARIYDVTDLCFTGKNAHHFFEIAVPYQNGYWFVKGLTPNRSYIAELGVQLPGYDFFPFFRSNCLQTTSTDIPNNDEPSHHLLDNQRYEENPPKWLEDVSTYSYYGEPRNKGEQHE